MRYIDKFIGRLEMLYDEGLGPFLAIIGIECMILALISLFASP